MFSALDDREVEDILAGRGPVTGELAPVSTLVSTLRWMAAHEPVPPMAEALRRQLTSAILPIDGGQAVRRSLVKAVMAAAAVVALIAMVGVGAAQNRLPTAIQDVVSSTAGHFGLDVPTSDERPTGQHNRDSSAPVPERATPARPNRPAEPAVPATPPTPSAAPEPSSPPQTPAASAGPVTATSDDGAIVAPAPIGDVSSSSNGVTEPVAPTPSEDPAPGQSGTKSPARPVDPGPGSVPEPVAEHRPPDAGPKEGSGLPAATPGRGAVSR
ncbi:MAG: hypothetical protein ABWZ76_13405 [Acidimicrobiales bacterium]